MLAGPIVTRELTTAPRKYQHFGLRAGYAAAMCVLMFTCSQSTFASEIPRGIGDISRFSVFVFDLMCFVQLLIVTGASLLFAAGNVSQEKDRRTLILLLMTDLKNTELVIGKTLAGLLPVFTMIAVSIPVLMSLTILGGITIDQIVWFEILCVVAALAAGSWGALVAFWRDKTFQTIAITLMGAGIFLGTVQILGTLIGAETLVGRFFLSFNPFHALSTLLRPLAVRVDGESASSLAIHSSLSLLGLAIALWVYTCLRVRIWNPTRAVFLTTVDEKTTPDAENAASETLTTENVDAVSVSQLVAEGTDAQEAEEELDRATTAVRASRTIWDTPIIWREICTQAYGNRVGLIKAAYFLVAVASLVWLRGIPEDAPLIRGVMTASGVAFVLLSLLALILVNAQAVTSLTSERDGQTLELLLVTEVTAKEFIFGKLGGALFNMKEVIVVPVVFAVMAWAQGQYNLEGLIFLLLGYLTLVVFATTLGLHSGLTFSNSRSAIMNSLGTLFFLFVGVFVCMLLIVEARKSFALQFVPFSFFMFGGGLGLWSSLTHKNPSTALTTSAWLLPFLTFYAIVSFLLNDTAAVFMAVVVPFGFTVAAMLVPAVSAFDVALGRTTNDRG
ncbi:ABC-2 family transporter protein [Thalassoglobus neptunius]|uniref:ABC-2 family transporter protein n=1 Tax=Thalassoglobus neptunius TaxID=1938619 RepID=A0A5C5X516_9PLAN|nr:ABC transporter permease subunit [Thalassoglobus neptunius]TWT57333.1 ABC-2 family transporter protein [Thalassoglobus neptunius]